ncbi:hypothetical protein DWZ94_02720 [Veillonella atypica]|nr:hypothetical protein DWZ94_02720 [Veillonella atypica]
MPTSKFVLMVPPLLKLISFFVKAFIRNMVSYKSLVKHILYHILMDIYISIELVWIIYQEVL